MLRRARWLSDDDVAAFARSCFATRSEQRFGAEIEFLTAYRDAPLGAVPEDTIRSLLAPVSTTSRLSLEPGGQIELSSTPAGSIDELIAELRADLARVDAAFAAGGVVLHGV